MTATVRGAAALPRLHTPQGSVEYLVRGTGDPVTVFAHGLAASITETRPLGSGVLGRRVFFHFRDHGGSESPDLPWSYAGLAEQLAAVCDHVGATRALGVSMGAGALTALLARDPGRFERAVMFCPAVLDEPRDDVAHSTVERIAERVEAGDVEGIAAAMLDEQPEALRDDPRVADWTRAQAQQIAGTAVAKAMRAIPRAVPLSDRAQLAEVQAPVLVIGQQGDPVHLASVAEELAAALPRGRLHLFSEAGAMWHARRRLREVIAGFLNSPDP